MSAFHRLEMSENNMNLNGLPSNVQNRFFDCNDLSVFTMQINLNPIISKLSVYKPRYLRNMFGCFSLVNLLPVFCLLIP